MEKRCDEMMLNGISGTYSGHVVDRAYGFAEAIEFIKTERKLMKQKRKRKDKRL